MNYGCVTLGKTLNLSEPQFPRLQKWKKSQYLQGSCEEVEVIYIKCLAHRKCTTHVAPWLIQGSSFKP